MCRRGSPATGRRDEHAGDRDRTWIGTVGSRLVSRGRLIRAKSPATGRPSPAEHGLLLLRPKAIA